MSALILFATVYGLAVAAPGPGIMALVARVLAHGRAGVWAFILGYVIGDLIWFTLAATGLALIAHSFATAFLIVKYAGVAYLLYLAWRVWHAPLPAGGAVRQLLAGLTLTLGNPKVMVFFLAILPTFVDLGGLTLAAGLAIAALIALILSLVLWLYALAAHGARGLFRSARAMRLLNRLSGTAISAAALAIAAR